MGFVTLDNGANITLYRFGKKFRRREINLREVNETDIGLGSSERFGVCINERSDG